MSNRGTSPSWDDEQIARYGLFPHLDMVAAPFKAEMRARHARLIQENSAHALSFLPRDTPEARARIARTREEIDARIAYAIPRTFSALDLGDMAIETWRVSIAMDMYDNYCVRTGKKLRTPFPDLPTDEQQPFLDIIEAISQVWKTTHTTPASSLNCS